MRKNASSKPLCSLDTHLGKFRLRWTYRGRRFFKRLRKLNLDAAGLARAEDARQAVEQQLRDGADPRVMLNMPIVAPTALPQQPAGMTVRAYFGHWIEDQLPPRVRPAQARDYRRHLTQYVLPHHGDLEITALTPRSMVNLQMLLLAQPLTPHATARLQMARRKEQGTRTLTVKTVKNIMLASYRAMLRDAIGIDMHRPVVTLPELFVGLKTGWGAEQRESPEADPLTETERDRVLAWFRGAHFGAAPGSPVALRPHPSYHAYVFLLLWTGMRPSEASGLRWMDIDLERQIAMVRGSRHSYARNTRTKTKSARRDVELDRETTRVLRDLMPLRVEPAMAVFTTVRGAPIEPKVIASHWYRALRALGIRMRGLYATKDTFCSWAASRNPNPTWLENQTGVSWATLRRHYAKWFPAGTTSTTADDMKATDRARQHLRPVSEEGDA
jgi:integrase